MIRGPVIAGTFAVGAKGMVKGIRQIQEGWHGGATPQGWHAVRESAVGLIPFVEPATYVAEDKPTPIVWDAVTVVVRFRTNPDTGGFKAAQENGFYIE